MVETAYHDAKMLISMEWDYVHHLSDRQRQLIVMKACTAGI